MSDELNELQSITHQYRKSLAAYEARTGLAPQSVDNRGSGEEKQVFARMDADLSAVENSISGGAGVTVQKRRHLAAGHRIARRERRG